MKLTQKIREKIQTVVMKRLKWIETDMAYKAPEIRKPLPSYYMIISDSINEVLEGGE